ncbi:MAG: hypothetical protein WDN30_14635 [Pararobbsia sp.]
MAKKQEPYRVATMSGNRAAAVQENAAAARPARVSAHAGADFRRSGGVPRAPQLFTQASQELREGTQMT